MSRSKRSYGLNAARVPISCAIATAIAFGSALYANAAEPTPPANAAEGWSEGAEPAARADKEGHKDRVPAKDRTKVLGSGYTTSTDTAWTTIGDATGFHLLTADEKDGYRWKTAATLAEPGFVDTDTWIGNACVTASGDRAVVAYAPRTFTNKLDLMARGAFTATVDLNTGAVEKLPYQASLAYFSPGCGDGEQAVLSQFTDEKTSKKNETRLITVDARNGKTAKPITVKGQVTSAVPTRDGIVAAQGNAIVRVGQDGRSTLVTRTDNVPFSLSVTKEGGLAFVDRKHDAKKAGKARAAGARSDELASAGQTSRVKYLTGGEVKGRAAKARTVAEGNLTSVDLTRSADGTAVVTGHAKNVGALPASVRNPGGLDKDAVVSTKARSSVFSSWADGKDTRIRPEEYAQARTARIAMRHLPTGRDSVLEANPAAAPVNPDPAEGAGRSPALGVAPAGSPSTAGGKARLSIAEPEAERTCAVERGNPQKQAFQPKPRQIEWAVNRAIEGTLDAKVSRPANWKNMGMGAYSPQALAGGLTALTGGGRIPAQVFLGITAQESNMWQATRFAAPGTTANSLIGNYYGVKHNAHGQVSDPWLINWKAADCGYGITQVTDGMRLPNKPYENGTVRPSKPRLYQEAVALDYTANVAAGVNILAEKWNQTRGEGMTVNNGDPKHIENWFFALWAYNSGFYPQANAGTNSGKWGVGWANNPANPTYKPNRTPFLEGPTGADDYSHAAKPQFWPYPEKVIGWAARPLEALEEPGKMVHGYRAAWWTQTSFRTLAKPPVGLFCNTSNECDPMKIQDGASNDSPATGPCQRADWKCWWNAKVEWKKCESSMCGFELFRFNSTYPEEADGNSHPPRCNSGLPIGTTIVDNVNTGQRIAGADFRRCTDTAQSSGSFSFNFASPSAKMDTHQLGVGYGNHMWFSTTRKAASAEAPRMKVTGTWTGPSTVSGWTRVLVHMPNVAARSQHAKYTVSGTNSTSPQRVAPQRIRSNEWRSLGVFNFTGTPSVSLSNITEEKVGVDIAWDAVAFQKLSSNPTHVVGMGDSFASGEGADTDGGKDYFRETDYKESLGGTEVKNTCHRSKHAWVRQATLPGKTQSIGAISDAYGDVDLNFIACSGAQTFNIWKGGKLQENSLPQMELGYLDNNTDMVTLAVGGNDSLFVPIIEECIYKAGLLMCQDAEIGVPDPNTGDDTGTKSGPLKNFIPGWITNQVKPKIIRVLNEIKTAAPNAKIFLMGYPPLLSGLGQCIPGIGTGEAPWLNEQVAPHLATEMGNAAAAVGATYVNPAQDFAGKAVCGNPESIHGIVLSGRSEADTDAPLPSMKSFHPKIEGARLYANALDRHL
ncbi:GDSL-type esterase/lipase family protein [Streptomyces clavuligerus]|uniref:GDSL-type esterase/lipase family protein n=1 Tax=Streptomyces clavuligerus TaxID=1901 RepID=UPI00018007D5|nr:GDSL-type esterase/lipase family protein [Streptomyces clavuligerus]ANW17294.1 NocE [Streptomyces clavuligerus]AXU11840.1 NocE [Streptomyces clavuligerus]EDY52011.1 NocE [Streptomyces clavuligerus]MBY6301677.1 NocE [Streptomyces clavuligerus]QCS04618.1 NocE [Streptomyces clavuligerus]